LKQFSRSKSTHIDNCCFHRFWDDGAPKQRFLVVRKRTMSSLFNCCKGKNSGHIRDDGPSSSSQASTGFPVAAGPSTTAAAATTASWPNTVGEALRAYSLFSMTALKHGESINTTSQKKRPAVDSGRLENQKKSSRQQQQHHLDTAPTAAATADHPKATAAEKFTMKEWDPCTRRRRSPTSLAGCTFQ
jgi:hypothetical protein